MRTERKQKSCRERKRNNHDSREEKVLKSALELFSPSSINVR